LRLKAGKFKPYKLLDYKENEFQIILLYSHDPFIKKNILYKVQEALHHKLSKMGYYIRENVYNRE